MWFKKNYRRVFLDMHIDDWNEEFLSKLDPKAVVDTIKTCGAQQIVVKAKPHTGLCYWPASVGRMHTGLKGRDYVGEMIELCHANGIAAMV
ncbi:MAG: alpha-L-fucosidase [Spirochaetota bacterium]